MDDVLDFAQTDKYVLINGGFLKEIISAWAESKTLKILSLN